MTYRYQTMIDKIDWNELKPYKNSKNHSFEKFCYVIANRHFKDQGQFTPIDDSGGGDGVEFYLTLPNGDVWGWQAKLFEGNPRLGYSGRKPSIKKSLEKACKIHPNLKKWFLCTHFDFTPKENEWFFETLRKSISNGMVELIHWGDSDFLKWMSEERFHGIYQFFFGKLELDLEWFKTQFGKQKASVGDKFDSSLHTETNVDSEVHALLGDKSFVHQITKWIEKLEDALSELEDAINDLNSSIPYIEWNKKERLKVVKAAESLKDVIVDMKVKLKKTRDLLAEKNFSEAQSIDWLAAYERLYKTFDAYGKVVKESGTTKMKCTTEKRYEDQVLNYARSIVYGPDNLVARLLDEFFPSVIWQLGLINESDLHILGDAGIGKTHIACNICEDRLKNGLPALFVRGSQFRTDQAIEVQLREILGIPPSYSWPNFLQALSAAAEAYYTRIPLIIDGINESVHNGTFSNIWELELKGLVQEIAKTKNLVLITTCRTSYEEAIWKEISSREDIIRGKIIWKDKDSLNLVYAYGFDPYEEVEPAVKKYFNAYKIKADLTGAPLAQFEHPIYLKIFCETKNRERKTEKEIYVGEETLFEVFEEYLNQCNRAVCKQLSLHPRTIIVQSALNKMAEYLWQHSSREIPFEELLHIIDCQSREHLDWPSSKTRAIESEGLLVYRDWTGVGEVMHFTYDLLGGYLIAKYLVEQTTDNVHGFLNSEGIVAALFSEDHQTLHPMHEDICKCLAALLPGKTGKFLHDFSNNKKAFGLSIRTLFEISPRDINQECIELVTHLFDQYQENRDFFFKSAETTVGHFNHPFNASFWSERLLALSMPERDLSWTEYVRRNRYSFEETVMRFEETCRDAQDLSEERLNLLAEYIMWILTSTVRPLRDKATRALYWYGRRYPKGFFDLVLKSFSINDPYVPERMLAATYGIAMAHHNNFEKDSFIEEVLPIYGRELYGNMFRSEAPHATTHILARDYAKRTIDIALIHHPELLKNDEKARITPPFTDSEIREWGESENKEEGPPPVQMDFDVYTLKGLVKSDDSAAEEYKRVKANIYWRIYDLGFSLENFGEIDGWIAKDNFHFGRSGDGRKTDRYGKKYSWIAYFELAGFRQDQGILPNFYDHGRCIESDIDPSFPEKHREYNLVTAGFLGDREASTEQWVLKSPHPDLTPYLKVDQLCEEQGPWVVLRGYLSQEDKQVNRSMFTWLQGLIVKSAEVEEIVEILNRQENIDGHTVPSIPEDYRTYAGEIPWCDTYLPNNWQEFSFLVRKYTIPKKQIEILHDGKPISLLDEIKLRNNIRNLIEKDDENRLKELLRERNLEITIKTVDEERLEHKDFEVLVPVRDNCWEESCSAANPRRSISIPAREIADSLDLHGHPQSFDLFEKVSGKRASISFRDGEIWGNVQHFTYLRKDLLDRFLTEIDGELIWVIWGNRLQLSENYDGEIKNFQEVITYSEIRKLSVQS